MGKNIFDGKPKMTKIWIWKFKTFKKKSKIIPVSFKKIIFEQPNFVYNLVFVFLSKFQANTIFEYNFVMNFFQK